MNKAYFQVFSVPDCYSNYKKIMHNFNIHNRYIRKKMQGSPIFLWFIDFSVENNNHLFIYIEGDITSILKKL